MAQFDDLTACNYFPVPSESLVCIGWLSSEREYARGSVSTEFFQKLVALCREPWQPVLAAGGHTCQLCQFDGPRFYSNVFIPFGGCIYVAPVAIIHYIACHWYKPPDIFVQAVRECPSMNSMAYKKAILANGGRLLVKATAN